jgi:hypothetical protein
MKVRELQKRLKKVDPNLDVIVVTAGPAMVREVEFKDPDMLDLIGYGRKGELARTTPIPALILAGLEEVMATEGPTLEDESVGKHLYLFA